MSKLFNTVKTAKPGRSTFDLSHDVKMSMKQGYLTPCLAMEVVPGDKVKQSVDTLIRFAPMQTPVMHEFKCSVHYWFVPYRLVWPNWQEFITHTINGLGPEMPFIDIPYGDCTPGTLTDYLGLGMSNYQGAWETHAFGMNALHHAAYQCIYNEKYRDQNLVTPVDYVLNDGNNNSRLSQLLPLRRRAWEHDYYTACLPFAQKGPTVDIPVGEFVDVPVELENGSFKSGLLRKYNDTPLAGGPDLDVEAGVIPGDPAAAALRTVEADTGGFQQPVAYDPNGTLMARTSDLVAQSATINNLRLAVQLQKYFEAAARGGTRYYEWVRSMFGVNPSDSRFQQPEFLGGSVSKAVVSEVLQNSQTDETPQANMAGHGYAVASGKQFSRYFEEYGVIIGVINVQPRTAYQQGLPKAFSRKKPTDYYNPFFANLGEQEVLNKEIFFKGNGTTDNELFGYIPRFSEYKYMPSRVAGQFKTTLNSWTAARIFPSQPALNANFVSADPTKRFFAVTDSNEDELWCQVFNNISASRPMPFFGTPAGL